MPEGVEVSKFSDDFDSLDCRVEELLEADFTVDEMMEAEVTGEYDARWGGFAFVPPRRFVEAVVTSLSR